MESSTIFGERRTVEQVEEGNQLAPKFDADGLIPAVTTDYESGELLMHGYMNAEALALSLIHISEPTRPPLLSRMPSSA